MGQKESKLDQKADTLCLLFEGTFELRGRDDPETETSKQKTTDDASRNRRRQKSYKASKCNISTVNRLGNSLQTQNEFEKCAKNSLVNA